MSGDAGRTLDTRFPNLDPAVVQGYLDAPETMVAEIIDGELSLMPRPRPRHSRAATRLTAELRPFDNPRGDEPGGWILLIEPELELGPRPDILIPDLAGWRRERVPPGFLQADEITLAPDWVCEVLSPSTFRVDRKRKLPIYHREGVGHVWLVDPARQALEVFRRAPEGWLLVGDFDGADVVGAEPFEAVPLNLAMLWAE
ncbi:MAG: Uma2 family endonuclease [Deltaproteobacteria bacterium]|nr:Uma2 family endonuclease [Myxococcales bacterium]MDP3218302.1 Uma2 family endonuclease [Deltaproteobacteria bacterium]